MMSGTSLDGVDAAWVETDGERIGRLGPRLTLPLRRRLRRDLRELLDRAAAATAGNGLPPDDPLLVDLRPPPDPPPRRGVAALAEART
jgi:anhydro-N-acetylmuramic acid kinase